MRRKIGTTLDEALYRRAKETAQRQGRGVNELIEEALARFLEIERSPASIVAKTKGIFKVSERALRAALNDDFYGAD